MSDSMTRREFAGCMVGTGLSASAGVPACMGGEDQPKGNAGTAKLPPSPLELTLELVQQQYPHEKLVDAALDEIRSDIRHHLSRSQVLSRHPLTNADEPGFVFAAWRSDRSET